MNSEEILKLEAAIRKQGEIDGIQRYSTGIACISAGKVLVVKRADDDFFGGMFELPGGKIETGETFEESIVREISEECGLKISKIVAAYRAFDYASQSGKSTRQINFIVECSTTDVKLSHEHTESRWIEKNSLKELPITEVMRRSIEEVFEKL